MNTARRAAAVAAALSLTVMTAPAALADPGDPDYPSAGDVATAQSAVTQAAEKQRGLEARLTAAQNRLEAATTAAEQAAEDYNAARVLLNQRNAAATTAKKADAAAKQRAAAAKDKLDDLAASVYMQGGSLSGLEPLLAVVGTGELARRAADVDAVTGFRDATLTDAKDASAAAAAASRRAAQAALQQKAAAQKAAEAQAAAATHQQAAASQAAAIEQERAALVAELAQLRRTSVKLEQSRLDGIAAQEAERRAAAAGSTAYRGGPLPAADSARAARAIEFAKAQLGDPYVWAAEGPNSWDCSGLTMKAWEAAGRRLTHYSGAQYSETARVPLSQLKPGDLVFFGRTNGSIHHVGLYVGNGTMIEAPRTGLNVRYSSIYRSSLLPYGGRP